MTKPSSNWEREPVVEVVLGVQFDELPGMTTGHLGWFWGECADEFPDADDVPAIGQIDESGGGFASFPGRRSRLRLVSKDRSRMIQVQNGWFVVNWMKRPDLGYPGYAGMRSFFLGLFGHFAAFCKGRGLDELRPNLWEVTYIDHIPRGTVWTGHSDFVQVFPGLLGPGRVPAGSLEALDGSWSWRTGQGRLDLSIQSARTTSEPEQETLVVRSVARGPLAPSADLGEALDFGRRTVVETFETIASPEAIAYWKGDA